jgi:DedD protein
VPELTHDAEDGFHEIQLSGKQLVFLFMATTVVSVVIFLCGVLVGRGVRAERGDDTGVAAAAPAAPAPVVQTTPAPAEPPTPPAADELSYDKRLRGNAPAEQLKKPAETTAAKPAPVPQPPPPQAAAPPAAVQQAAAISATLPGGARAADVPTSARAGNWVIQVHALQNREAASTFVRRLTAKGYPAFLLAPSAGSPQIFRVQIGAFADRGEAEKIATRLEKEEQLNPAIKRR